MQGMDIILEVLGKSNLTPLIAYALRFFLRNRYESLCIVNKDSKIEFLDRASERFFGIKEGSAKGLHISKLVPKSGLPKVIETGIPVIGRIFEIKDKRWISTSYPIIRDGEIIGALAKLTLFSLEEVEKINNEVNRLRREVTYFKEKERNDYGKIYTFDNILGISTKIRNVVEMAKKIALIDSDVLIIGESGTGKELFAHSIHSFAYNDKPFVRVNCSAIPFELAESEFFGYEKGTFTGALTSGKPGKFETAHNGTIFLDEISSLPLSVQPKLLRVLQEREVERLGSTSPKNINFKLIAATNKDLKELVKQGKFRDDLFYRIAKAIIHIPPLRERIEDIPIYLSHFLQKINPSFKTKVERISNDAMDIFQNYSWPGNVRELINMLEQAVLKSWNCSEIDVANLPQELTQYSQDLPQVIVNSNGKRIRDELSDKEKELIVSTLKMKNGNKRQVALLLGMARSTLYEKIKKYQIG